MTFDTGDFLVRPFQPVTRITVMYKFLRHPVIGRMGTGAVGPFGRISGGKLPFVNVVVAVLAEFLPGSEGDVEITPLFLHRMTFNARSGLMFSYQREFRQTVVKEEFCPGFLEMA